MTLANGRPYLAIPGPSVLPDRVVQAMQRPSPNIYAGALPEMVEQLGADTLLHVGHGAETIIARMPHEIRHEVGSTIHLAADPVRVFLFDSASGARMR